MSARRRRYEAIYEASYRWREISVSLALSTADLVDAIERAEQEAPDAPEMAHSRRQAAEAIRDIRDAVEELG